jgi:signal transduction histidine kinase
VSGGRVLGDAAALSRVVRNLMDNAERHARSHVTVAVRTHEQTVELVVTDDGPGVPVAERERIFERFARVDESRVASDGGTGLGLAIVREIVVAHRGTIELGGAEPGAQFVVRLPACE